MFVVVILTLYGSGCVDDNEKTGELVIGIVPPIPNTDVGLTPVLTGRDGDGRSPEGFCPMCSCSFGCSSRQAVLLDAYDHRRQVEVLHSWFFS